MSRARRRAGAAIGVVAVGAAAAVGAILVDRSLSDDGAPSASASVAPLPTEGDPDVVVEPGPGAEVATDEPPVPDPSGEVQVVLGLLEWDEDAGAVVAAGFVSGVVESDGTCTLTLEGDGASAVVEAPAEPDASTTVCGGLAVDGGQLAAGEWTGVLTYRSAGSAGASAPVPVEVPHP